MKNIKLGDGFDSVQGEIRKSILDNIRGVSHSENTPEKIVNQLFDSFAELKNHLKASFLTELLVLLEKNSAGFVDSTKVQLFHLFSFEQLEKRESLDFNSSNTKNLQEILPQNFYPQYGDSFVKELRYGKQAIVLFCYSIAATAYTANVKLKLLNFITEGKPSKTLTKLYAANKLTVISYGLQQGVTVAPLKIKKLTQFKEIINEQVIAAKLSAEPILLHYETDFYQGLNFAAFSKVMQEQSHLVKTALEQMENCAKMITIYVNLIEKEMKSGNHVESWKQADNQLKIIAARRDLLEQQLRDGAIYPETGAWIQNINALFVELARRTASIDQTQIATLFTAKTFKLNRNTYKSRGFKLEIPEDTQWLSFQFDIKNSTVALRSKSRFGIQKSLLTNLIADQKITAEALQTLKQLVKKSHKLYFEINSKSHEPFVWDEHASITVVSGRQALKDLIKVVPLVGFEQVAKIASEVAATLAPVADAPMAASTERSSTRKDSTASSDLEWSVTSATIMAIFKDQPVETPMTMMLTSAGKVADVGVSEIAAKPAPLAEVGLALIAKTKALTHRMVATEQNEAEHATELLTAADLVLQLCARIEAKLCGQESLTTVIKAKTSTHRMVAKKQNESECSSELLATAETVLQSCINVETEIQRSVHPLSFPHYANHRARTLLDQSESNKSSTSFKHSALS